MTKRQAQEIIALLLNRATLNAAEVYAANEALKALISEPKADSEPSSDPKPE